MTFHHNLIFYSITICLSNIRMGNCFSNTPAVQKFSTVPGLLGLKGEIIQVKGLRIDFTVKQVYKSCLVQIEFISSLSGDRNIIHRCLHIPDLPESVNRKDIEEAFAKSTRNVLNISEDNTYFYEGNVMVIIEDVTYDFGQYLRLKSFARFHSTNRPVSPSRVEQNRVEQKGISDFEEILPANFPRRINLSHLGKSEANEFVSEKKIIMAAGVPISSSANTSNPAEDHIVDSPKTDHAVSRSMGKLEIIENQFS